MQEKGQGTEMPAARPIAAPAAHDRIPFASTCNDEEELHTHMQVRICHCLRLLEPALLVQLAWNAVIIFIPSKAFPATCWMWQKPSDT